MSLIKFGFIVVSDACYAKTRKDKTSPALEESILSTFPKSKVTARAVVPNDKICLQKALISLLTANCNVIITIGGTGSSSKDITPEATKSFVEKEMPGMTYAMLSKTLQIDDIPMLSRAVCGAKGSTLVINLSADQRNALDCFDFIKRSIPLALTQLTTKKKSHGESQELIHVTSKVKLTDLSKRIKLASEEVSVSGAIFLMFMTCHSYSEVEIIDVQISLARILGEDVVSTEPCPPFPTAIVDGYAVKSMDGTGIHSVRQSRSRKPLGNGEIISVNSGSALPQGADAVVQIENTTLIEVSDDSSKELRVEIRCCPSVGMGVRGVGYDVPSFKPVLYKQDKVTPAHIGILCAIGRTKVTVFKRPSVAIVSVGKELQKYNEKLTPDHVFDSTKALLINLFKQHFYVALDAGIIDDEPANIKRILLNVFAQYDVIIFTGGIHMGEKPVIKEVLVQDFQATVHYERVLMIPGFTLFATCMCNKDEMKMIFALSGNHSSVSLATILLIIPLLKHLENCKDKFVPKMPLFLDKSVNINHSQDFIKLKLETKDEDTVIHCGDNECRDDNVRKLDSFINTGGLVRWMDVKEIQNETCRDCTQKLCEKCRNNVVGTCVDVILIDLL